MGLFSNKSPKASASRLKPGQIHDRDFIANSIGLNNTANYASRDGRQEEAMALFDRAASMGQPNALASLIWHRMLLGLIEDAIAAFENYFPRVNIWMDSIIPELRAALLPQLPNCKSNAGLAYLALGNRDEALRLWSEAGADGHAEAKLYPAVLAARDGDHSRAKKLLKRLSPPEIVDLKKTMGGVISEGTGWFSEWAGDVLRLLASEGDALTTVRLTAKSGRQVEYVDTIIGQGGMKDVYMSPDKTYVVAFFRDKLDAAGRERLEAIVGAYREGIFNKEGGAYWQDLYCWPDDIVEHQGRIGVTTPVYRSTFFFEHGSVNGDILGIKGKEKEGKWFASALNRSKYLDPRERGSWMTHLRLCLMISRAVRRLHAAGLAHSDLSYKNVLVDPATGTACIIDIDGLVVPNKFPPDVVGTPDFIAPEVVATSHLAINDPNRKLPSSLTDRHALATLIYLYLFYRHPLRGGRVLDQDPGRDEDLNMGEKALFIEHPTDTSNRVKVSQLPTSVLPWGDPAKIPYTMAGPLLADLFQRAFIDGLHDPSKRPLPAEWETALVRTTDLLQPCSNAACDMKWYVFDNTTRPTCPCCGTMYQGSLPVLNLYSSRQAGSYRADNHRIMVWDGQSLYPWHVNRNIFPGERLTNEQKKRVGYFRMHQGEWVLVNEGLPAMKDVGEDRNVPIGEFVHLREDTQILLSPQEGGRLIHVQLAGR